MTSPATLKKMVSTQVAGVMFSTVVRAIQSLNSYAQSKEMETVYGGLNIAHHSSLLKNQLNVPFHAILKDHAQAQVVSLLNQVRLTFIDFS